MPHCGHQASYDQYGSSCLPVIGQPWASRPNLNKQPRLVQRAFVPSFGLPTSCSLQVLKSMFISLTHKGVSHGHLRASMKLLGSRRPVVVVPYSSVAEAPDAFSLFRMQWTQGKCQGSTRKPASMQLGVLVSGRLRSQMGQLDQAEGASMLFLGPGVGGNGREPRSCLWKSSTSSRAVNLR